MLAPRAVTLLDVAGEQPLETGREEPARRVDGDEAQPGDALEHGEMLTVACTGSGSRNARA